MEMEKIDVLLGLQWGDFLCRVVCSHKINAFRWKREGTVGSVSAIYHSSHHIADGYLYGAAG